MNTQTIKWPLERILFAMAGSMTLISALLAATVSPLARRRMEIAPGTARPRHRNSKPAKNSVIRSVACDKRQPAAG